MFPSGIAQENQAQGGYASPVNVPGIPRREAPREATFYLCLPERSRGVPEASRRDLSAPPQAVGGLLRCARNDRVGGCLIEGSRKRARIKADKPHLSKYRGFLGEGGLGTTPSAVIARSPWATKQSPSTCEPAFEFVSPPIQQGDCFAALAMTGWEDVSLRGRAREPGSRRIRLTCQRTGDPSSRSSSGRHIPFVPPRAHSRGP